jgi:hypothetical protein
MNTSSRPESGEGELLFLFSDILIGWDFEMLAVSNFAAQLTAFQFAFSLGGEARPGCVQALYWIGWRRFTDTVGASLQP